MGSIIKSVSVTFEEDEFLKDYNLSPTSLLREKIWEMRGAIKKLVQMKIDRMSVVIHDQAETIIKLQNALEEESKDAA